MCGSQVKGGESQASVWVASKSGEVTSKSVEVASKSGEIAK
ncbi:hypothetical protein [Niallia circulans]|nr:hypothetical protein [Niallia circulans]